MINLEQIKITRRDQQVLNLLVPGVQQQRNRRGAKNQPSHRQAAPAHSLFLRAGIKQGRKRVILATAIFEKEQMNYVATRTA